MMFALLFFLYAGQNLKKVFFKKGRKGPPPTTCVRRGGRDILINWIIDVETNSEGLYLCWRIIWRSASSFAPEKSET